MARNSFELTADGVRQAAISYPADRECHVWPPEQIAENAAGYGFHCVPYNFDSAPKSDFFEKILRDLNLACDEVRDIYTAVNCIVPGHP